MTIHTGADNYHRFSYIAPLFVLVLFIIILLHMLHKLSFDANSMAVFYWQVHEFVFAKQFSFGELILPNTIVTPAVGLSSIMAQPIKFS